MPVASIPIGWCTQLLTLQAYKDSAAFVKLQAMASLLQEHGLSLMVVTDLYSTLPVPNGQMFSVSMRTFKMPGTSSGSYQSCVLTEFIQSWRDPGFSTHPRDQLVNTVHTLATRGGAAAGSSLRQLLIESLVSSRASYEVILSQSPSTASFIVYQSHKLVSDQ